MRDTALCAQNRLVVVVPVQVSSAGSNSSTSPHLRYIPHSFPTTSSTILIPPCRQTSARAHVAFAPTLLSVSGRTRPAASATRRSSSPTTTSVPPNFYPLYRELAHLTHEFTHFGYRDPVVDGLALMVDPYELDTRLESPPFLVAEHALVFDSREHRCVSPAQSPPLWKSSNTQE
ncbi:uncharacterized protein BXZ73DRAFT_101989 [Epithele typhae]|uniref:uncharacterized protein n=1 Tax=Epithele typhae TaxID=378194 RepID=UPI0020079B91|nr:uncharacterized protein BXZ73DRAFT_101989 [Epithele typhae]KAH9929926.1 hypothetical protein BXZ73DRAFT_101989 [Epithele typhae]